MEEEDEDSRHGKPAKFILVFSRMNSKMNHIVAQLFRKSLLGFFVILHKVLHFITISLRYPGNLVVRKRSDVCVKLRSYKNE